MRTAEEFLPALLLSRTELSRTVSGVNMHTVLNSARPWQHLEQRGVGDDVRPERSVALLPRLGLHLLQEVQGVLQVAPRMHASSSEL